MIELIDGAAIEFFRSDELITRLHQCMKDKEFGCVAGGDSKRCGAAFKRCNPSLKGRARRVGDASVNIAKGLQAK